MTIIIMMIIITIIIIIIIVILGTPTIPVSRGLPLGGGELFELVGNRGRSGMPEIDR